jgi:DNA-binding NtrC family response regulator
MAITNEDGRAAAMAMELVQYGVFNFMLKSEALPEFKTVVRRACEYAVLRQDLEDLRQQLPPASRGCSKPE